MEIKPDKHRLFLGLDVDHPDTPRKLFRYVLFAWGGSAAIIFIVFLCVKDPWPNRGQFGDMFGAINSLFSGLAFAGIIYTILVQREELKLQRNELQLTREELAGQKREFRTQNTTLKRQRFEGAFFNMLTIHSTIINMIASGSERGVMAFRVMAVNYVDAITDHKNRSNTGLYPEAKLKAMFESDIKKVSSIVKIVISPYVPSIVQLYQTIKASKFKPEAEKRYINLLQSYISKPERHLLYYYHYSTQDSKLNELIDGLSLFKDLNEVEYPEF